MPDKTTTSPPESETSISWKLIRKNLARREFAGKDMVEVDRVSGAADGSVVVSGKDSAGTFVQRTVEPDPAFERIAVEAARTGQRLEKWNEQVGHEAIFWFWASATVSVVGIALVIVGIVVVLFFQQNMVATLSAVCGVLLEAIAALLFKQRSDANKRVDEYREDLLGTQAINQAIELCRVIGDPETKKRQMETIIKKLLDAAIK